MVQGDCHCCVIQCRLNGHENCMSAPIEEFPCYSCYSGSFNSLNILWSRRDWADCSLVFNYHQEFESFMVDVAWSVIHLLASIALSFCPNRKVSIKNLRMLEIMWTSCCSMSLSQPNPCHVLWFNNFHCLCFQYLCYYICASISWYACVLHNFDFLFIFCYNTGHHEISSNHCISPHNPSVYIPCLVQHSRCCPAFQWHPQLWLWLDQCLWSGQIF